MPSQKVRKQLIFVNACRRRLKKMAIENGDQVQEGSAKSASFAQMVEELRMVMEDLTKLKKECDAVKNKKDGDSVRKRQEFNTEIKRAKDLLAEMRLSLRSLQKKIDKADKRGKTDNEKHQARVAELRMKEDTITALFTEIEKLSVQKEHEMNQQEDARLKDAGDVLKAVRRARREAMKDTMDGALDDPGTRHEPEPEENDPEFEANQREIEKNRKEQEAILGRISQGLGVLKQQAQNIGSQVEQSNARLDDMTTRADATKKDLKGLNRATLKALDEASNTSYFTNIACLLLLIALVGVAVYYLDLV